MSGSPAPVNPSIVPNPPSTASTGGLPEGLRGLERHRQFIIYRRLDKKPFNYKTGVIDNALNADCWTDWANAEATATAWGAGFVVGFVLTAAARKAVIDIDDCRDPLTGKLSDIALFIISLLPGAYVEVSISGTGIHIWFSYSGEMPVHACKVNGIEFYHCERGFVIGTAYEAPGFINGSVETDMTAMLPALVAAFFLPKATDTKMAWSAGHELGWELPDDAELIRRAMSLGGANAAFGDGITFADLWTRNVSKLSKAYPDETREFDESSADLALAGKLSWLTGNDCPRIERLMWQSALPRGKWESHKTYLCERTIPRALVKDGNFYDPKYRERQAAAGMGPLPIEAGSHSFLSLEQQKAHFEGCVYIENMNRALCPDGSILKQDAFSVRYGGFNFHMDADNQKVTDDTWKAWTKNRGYRCARAYGTCFKPKLPFGEILTRSGHSFVNTYRPLNIERKQGDPSPFLKHLAKVLPNERDATILLSYMAACVQHQGTKFQWAPLLQGVEGNGKTLFSRCVQQAVGERYTHWAKAADLGSNFNAWMTGKVFYAVEDIYVQDSKIEVMEALKPMITGTQIEIELKGVDKITAEICGNFMFNSNHQDAIRKTKNDRRFCVLFTAQQSMEDLSRDGIGPHSPYFPDLYKWLDGGGYAIVSEFLYTYEIPREFNPAGDCQRAPHTSTTNEAIEASQGGVEQDIKDAIEEERQGFCGGWISSHFVALLPRAQKLTSRKRHEILEGMGYVLHPHLKNGGRVDHRVMPDNGRSKLYISRTDVTLSQITSPAAIAKAYETTNQFAAAFGRGPYGN